MRPTALEKLLRAQQRAAPGTLVRSEQAIPVRALPRGELLARPGSRTRHNDVQHVTLVAAAGQAITAAGADVSWAAEVSSPAERDGIEALVALPVTEIPAELTGRRILTVFLRFDAEHSGTVEVARIRAGVRTTLEEETGTGRLYYGTFHIEIRPGDTIAVRVDPTEDASIEWGRVQATDLEDPYPPDLAEPSFLVAYNGRAADSFDAYEIGVGWSSDGVTWTPAAANPILSPGAGGSWDDAHVKDPHVVYVAGVFHMLYAGHDGSNWRIGYATSSDGETWTKQGQVLGLGGSGAADETALVFPTLYHDPDDAGAEWKVWYGGSDAAGVATICYASGSSLTTLTKHGRVLNVGASGAFDDVGLLPGAVTKVGSTWHLLYAGRPNASAHPIGWQPGLATFTDPTGPYTKHPGNPLFARRSSAYQALTSDAPQGDVTFTVADSSVFEVGEPVVMDDSDASWAVPYVVSIDSPTQITVSFGATLGDLLVSQGAYVASLFYGSLFPRSVRELDDGTWIIYGTSFQFGTSDELAEVAVAWTAPTLDGVWIPDYTQNFGNDTAQGWMLPTGTTTSWSGRSAENPSVVRVN